MDMNKTVRFSESLFLQQVDDELVLLDMNTESYFGLDSVAGDIWKLLQEGRTIQETFNTLLATYDVGPDTLKKDLVAFVNTLVDNKLASLV